MFFFALRSSVLSVLAFGHLSYSFRIIATQRQVKACRSVPPPTTHAPSLAHFCDEISGVRSSPSSFGVHATKLYSAASSEETFVTAPATALVTVASSFWTTAPAETVDDVLYPESRYRERMAVGYEAQGIPSIPTAVGREEESLAYTYAEFPLESFMDLVDLARSHRVDDDSGVDGRRSSLVDLGSGCGRLVAYAALELERRRREGFDDARCWGVHGVEISPLLHDYAVRTVESGVKKGVFSSSDGTVESETCTSIRLHLGPADEQHDVLAAADVIFAYCTVWPASIFSPDVGTMILDASWSEMMARRCSNRCVVVTTDRALDPIHGWRLLDRMDVENPDVAGSTGFVQVLEK